ncbi:MAG: alpha/beta fold hydrolase [Acidimicrobiales bacterium]|nr:alpha/beta fold hydrolase [Acidimicrobiales bacterium]
MGSTGGDDVDRRPWLGLATAGAGAVAVGIGIGFLPHLGDGGSMALAAAGALATLAGLVAVVVGTRWILRGRGRPAVVAGTATAIVATLLVAWTVGPAVAATHVPASSVTRTPDDVGLRHESVTVATADGVDLAAWYIEGTNGAGLVLAHGAGSTRSDVLDQARVLSDAGYHLLLVDARGHGDSGGRAMDLGWYGDLDLTAAVDHLAATDGVDPDRIGVVGLSMGGEEAIGVAAADDRVRAVVAEGATSRTAADKAWYSDAYGFRGTVQEQIEHLQTGLVDLLTPASPPASLRSSIAEATQARVLLIAAGGVEDEGRAAADLASVAPDRVTVWEVEGAGHTAGLRTDPAGWETTVVAFLDDALPLTTW